MTVNPLTLPTDEAAQIIRRRRAEAAKAVPISAKQQGWERAFEAVIFWYEKAGDQDMADLLRLDLDRFAREQHLHEQVKWDQQKKEKAG